MGEAKDTKIQQQIADDHERETDETWSEDRKIVTTEKGRSSTQYDPDHLNPQKGGNRAGDDYW